VSSYDEAAVGVDAQLRCRLPWSRPAVHPPAAYRLLRAERPVARALDEAGKPVWLVARYDDVRALLIDHRVSADQSRAGFPLGLHSPAPPESISFFRMDPPQHTAFRRVLGRSFSVRQVETLRPAIQGLVDAHISAILGHPWRQADFMSELAIPVPSAVLAWVLGIGQEDHAAFIRAAADLLRGPDRADPAGPRRALQALSDLRGLVRSWLECKNADPDADADVFSVLLQAVRAGTITMQDAENSGMLFVVAGHETTTSMAALGLYTLLRNPRQRADLSAHPDLLPGAVDELLRYLTVRGRASTC
jgi:cytochrome P450